MEKKSKMSFLSYLGHSRPLKWMLDVNKESFYNQTFCFAVIIHSIRVKYRLFKIRLSFWLIGSEMSNDIIISESTFFFSHTYIHFFNVHKYLKDQTIQGVSKVFRHLKWAVIGELVHLRFFLKKYQMK